MRLYVFLILDVYGLVSRITRRRIKVPAVAKTNVDMFATSAEYMGKVQNDDPYASYDASNYDSEIDVSSIDGEMDVILDDECDVEILVCDHEESDCTAEDLPEEDCRCSCQEDEPPKCQMDLVILVDVCSCSMEVWNGIKSYVKTIVKKIDRDIGIAEDLAHVSIIQYAADTDTVISLSNTEVNSDAATLVKVVENLKMDNFVAQGSYVTNGLRNVLEEFEKSRETATRVLITVSGGYNHPSVTLGDIRGAVQILTEMGVQTHSILRSDDKLLSGLECESFSSSKTGVDVCQRRAAAMKLLNGNDDNVFGYTDAEASHDVLEAAEKTCPHQEKKQIHCDCECPLPVGCPGEAGVTGKDGRVGPPGKPGQCGVDGVDGAQGPQGLPGIPGEMGLSGAAGVVGPPGEPGRFGPPGFNGERGRKGKSGDPGVKGVPGSNGHPGVSGAPGLPGVPGIMGVLGLPGPFGVNGTNTVIDMAMLREKVFAILDSLKPQ